MVARLIVDQFWRNRWFYAAVSTFMLPLWLLFEVMSSNPLLINTTVASLFFAAVLGPVATVATIGIRELRHLPVTNRDLWRASWILATVVSPTVLVATKLICAFLVAVFGGGSNMTAETILLSAVYDFSWTGTVLVIVTLSGYVGPAFAHHRSVAAPAGVAAAIVVPLVCFGLPIVVSGAIPARISEFTPATTAILIACLAITFGALAWTPRRGVLAGERPRPSRPAVLAAPQARFVDRLTGISRVAVPHVLATIALPASACLILVIYGITFGSGPWWFVPPVPEVFDPGDVGSHGLTYFVLLPSAVVTMMGLWTPWARLLRVLPLSVRQINALILLTPFVTWTTLWVLGWSAYVLAYGTPRTVRVGFALGMAALGALAHAAQLRLKGTTAQFWIFASMGGLIPQLVKVGLRDGTVAQVVFAAIGAIALCAAASINHRTLTQSTSSSPVYRRPQPPFGLSAGPTR